ncbi:hypothetical protein [Saccharicrinis aurantiacus]|uniref:hypothetical protein n=1 Tax=Saccharicrinis aurantiacus TaxID=1849719 RepID=UPI00248F7B99|nr:hypothetical protein [Saccharicrinis aurantiacus]
MFRYNNIINKLLLFTLLMGSMACSTTTIESPRQLLEKESLLLGEFLEFVDDGDHNPDLLGNRDYLAKVAVDTIDFLNVNDMTGIAYFEMETGTGDRPIQGQEVGYRFVEYRILRDTLEQPVAGGWSSNWGSADPAVFTIGESTSTLAQRGIPEGVAAAVTNMRLNGKSTVIMPSTLVGLNDYISRMYEVELTYVDPR